MPIPIRYKRGRRALSRGFTIIELMASLIVFMIAVMGMVSMQKASFSAADLARQETAAVDIARFFMTQIKTEFANWNRDEAETEPSSVRFKIIVEAKDGLDTLVEANVWHQLGAGDDTFRLDEFLGHSTLDDNYNVSRYCVNYMITQLENGPTHVQSSVWLVRVRVSWTKDGFFSTEDESTKWDNCTPQAVNTRLDPDELATDSAVEIVGAATRELASI